VLRADGLVTIASVAPEGDLLLGARAVPVQLSDAVQLAPRFSEQRDVRLASALAHQLSEYQPPAQQLLLADEQLQQQEQEQRQQQLLLAHRLLQPHAQSAFATHQSQPAIVLRAAADLGAHAQLQQASQTMLQVPHQGFELQQLILQQGATQDMQDASAVQAPHPLPQEWRRFGPF
jgi:hypothetical protein